MRAAFEGLPLAGATAVTEEIVEFLAGFPTMPLRARAGVKPGLQDSQKVACFLLKLHSFCIKGKFGMLLTLKADIKDIGH